MVHQQEPQLQQQYQHHQQQDISNPNNNNDNKSLRTLLGQYETVLIFTSNWIRFGKSPLTTGSAIPLPHSSRTYRFVPEVEAEMSHFMSVD